MVSQMSQKNPYLDAEGKPQLLPSYCIFIDILGFSTEIENAFIENKEAECFGKFHSSFSSMLEQLEEERCKYKCFWMKKVFSDNILIGTPVNTTDGTGEFLLSVPVISQIQLRFALEGYFIRGGWAVGNLTIDENMVCGYPLVEAYKIERKIAIYPRIVFSETMKRVIAYHLRLYENDSAFLHNQLLFSSGEIFINYLSELINDGSGYMTDIDLEKLEKHKCLIETQLTEHAHSRKILIKYRWLAAYHNAFCDGIQEHPEYSDEYKIYLRHSFKFLALDGKPWRYPIIQPHIV